MGHSLTVVGVIHGIDRILLGHNYFDITLINGVIFIFSGDLWPDGQVYSMYGWVDNSSLLIASQRGDN